MYRIILLLCLVTSVQAGDTCPGLPMCFCNKDKTSVNCEGKHLTSIPDKIPTSVVKLFLGYNQLTNITTGAFASFPKLERLQLERNKISIIYPHAFRNLPSLVLMDLRENKLSEIGHNAFSDMKNLQTLYLLTNRIQKVNESAFSGTENLAYLSLQANMLTSVPALGNMPNLKKLILEGNDIVNVTFPSSFATIQKPLYLGLSNNNIKSISRETFEALRNKTVSSLYLSRNKLAEVGTGALSPLGSIKSLKIGTNPLSASALRTVIMSLKGKDIASIDLSGIQLNGVLLENTFALLKNSTITTLNMRYNKIYKLPDRVFFGLNRLMHLDLTQCEIMDTSPDSFKGLDKLTILILNRNRLSSVPKNLPLSLTSLLMDDNEITTIENNAFYNLAYLQELRIRFNKVLTLEQDSFRGLVKLNKLSLYSNNIAILPGKVFSPLVRLTSLDLEKNNLVEIQYSKGRFSSFGSLLYLNLANNKLKYIQPDLFEYTLALKYLHLEQNMLANLLAEDFGGRLFKGLVNLKELFLMDNKIFAIPGPAFQNLDSLVFLNLTDNKIKGWGPNLFKTTPKLQVLDLTNNLIGTLVKENLKDLSALKSLNLTGNPFDCNCDLRWFRDWMNSTSVDLANSATYRCNGPNDWQGKKLLTFDRTKIVCWKLKWWYILIACAVAVLIVIIIAGTVYRKRWPLKLFMYKLTRNRRTRTLVAADGHGGYGALVNEGMYDAYISCAENDKKWVLENLLPGVDRGKIDDDNVFGGNFDLYFEDRDAEPGKFVRDVSLLMGSTYEIAT